MRLSCVPCALPLTVWAIALACGGVPGGRAWCEGPAEAGAKTSILHFRNLPEIDSVRLTSLFHGFESGVDRDTTDGELAYDYAVHIIYDTPQEKYRMYSGGRWLRREVSHADGDHILQHVSETGLPETWTMPRDRPEFWIGVEDGRPGEWWSNNCLEPEVLRVGDTYYMFAQCQINPGMPIDLPGMIAETGADRILLFTSPDGSDWTRWEDRGVIVGFDQPTKSNVHHEEVVYVPWDADGKPFWMYVASFVDGSAYGYARMRSADPKTFDWQTREPANLAQLGNQIGYALDAPGGPLFVRITFVGDATERWVPSLQFSRDGLDWFWGDEGPVLLDGSKDDENNTQCFFIGLSTLDGTGKLDQTGPHTFRAIYGATTCSTPVAPEIFYAEIGIGDLTIEFVPTADQTGTAE